MKRIPFTIEDWKAGGVPVTRSGEYVKQLTFFDGVKEGKSCMVGIIDNKMLLFFINGKFLLNINHGDDLFLEVPCEKWYTHYYRNVQNKIIAVVTKDSYPTYKNPFYTHIKTVEVEF